MSDASSQTHDTKKPPKNSTAILLLSTIAGTSWRMFVPTIGLMLLGNEADQRYGSAPWLALLGAATGAVIAALLIKQQLTKEL